MQHSPAPGQILGTFRSVPARNGFCISGCLRIVVFPIVIVIVIVAAMNAGVHKSLIFDQHVLNVAAATAG
jgi:hypothetical protein